MHCENSEYYSELQNSGKLFKSLLIIQTTFFRDLSVSEMNWFAATNFLDHACLVKLILVLGEKYS